MRIKSELVISRIAGQTVLMDMSSEESDDKMVSTNGTGAFLLELLEMERTEGQLVEALLDKYAVTEETAREHVRLFIKGLRELKFLDD